MEEPVTIVDRDTLKVLSVDTRMDIIKELYQGERTPSDLGKRLKKSDATIIEHLNGLIKVGLVKKIEHPGKKWVFYTLTERGKGILSSKSRRLIIVIATSILALVGSFLSFLKYKPLTVSTVAPLAERSVDEAQKGFGEAVIAQNQIYLYISIALFLIAVIGLSIYFIKKPKRNKYEERI